MKPNTRRTADFRGKHTVIECLNPTAFYVGLHFNSAMEKPEYYAMCASEESAKDYARHRNWPVPGEEAEAVR